MKRVLSYGGGTDSFAMLLEALRRGERPDVVVFVDVGDQRGEDPAEWPATYRHLDEHLRPLLARERIPFEVIDSDRYPVRDARSLFAWLAARKQIPVAGPKRICTRIAKVERFEAWCADTFPGEQLEVWIGFEAGEEDRAAKDPNAGKPSPWRFNRFPMIEWGLCRCRSEQLIRAAGYPVPPKSACVFCPYGTRGDWKRLAATEPATFAKIVDLEATKPPTAKNGVKLSIMNFRSKRNPDGSKTYRPDLLPSFVSKPYAPKRSTCEVCGGPRALKTAGCLEAA